MGQYVSATLTGGIVVENHAGHRFKFQLQLREHTTLQLVGVYWDGHESAMLGMRSLDEARAAARHVAERRGWLISASER